LAKDEALLLDFINTNTLKFIIAHNIKRNQIEQFKTVSQKTVLFSESRESLADFDVFIIDTIGILTTVMQTSLFFVGGGFGILAFITY
jgi:3-deoxy-D-manno-octulosonic-acid transferase